MNRKKVELLSPCGSYDSFLAAVNAGADAVYLAGAQFGARAYADNFTEEELVEVIHLAHLHQVRVYMTVNTLVKEEEFSALYDYMLPYYRAGLDGCIIQDLGVFHYFGRVFPEMERHVSTQMTVSSQYGAAFMKELGAERIVPARELTLAEIKEIKAHVDVELETFIHGSMCYCYSGQCLMSSILGGRSGNRGRCAQPCRLPYRISGQEQYYLSLKDMNTLQSLPELIEAGIDSFKIEGRMKRPEYVAGVTSIYRKYIDLYYRDPTHYQVSDKDLKKLSNLYIRTETGEGYYHQKRSKAMVTLEKPGYNETNEEQLEGLHHSYVKPLSKIELPLAVVCRVGEPLRATVLDSYAVSAEGPVVEMASKRAATREDLEKQLSKTGNTPFIITLQQVSMDQNAFVPVKWLNDLRRDIMQEIYLQTGERA